MLLVYRYVMFFMQANTISPSKVAADADDKLFISTSCCVQALNNIWYDKLNPNQLRKRDQVALIAGFLSLGLLAPVVVKYRSKTEV